MHHQRKSGQTNERFIFNGGRHRRGVDDNGDPIYLVRGDTFHATKDEMERTLAGRITMVATIPEIEDEPTEMTPDEVMTQGMEEAIQDAESEAASLRDHFASDKAYELWQEAGEPDITGIEGSASGGRFSASDVRGMFGD